MKIKATKETKETKKQTKNITSTPISLEEEHKGKWFKFLPTYDTLIALFCGILVVLLSVAMNYVEYGFSIVLRDYLMITMLGIIFPVYYFLIYKKESLSSLGIHKKKLRLSLVLNIGFGILLAFQLFSYDELYFGWNYVAPTLFIFIAGVFETLFFYAYLREMLERAFGIIPAIILSATSYSFHHAGFQPEFIKLILVGILYASVFRITKSVWAIYPVFWGVGAILDLFVQSEAINVLDIRYALVRSIGILIVVSIGLYIISIIKRKNKQNTIL